MIRSNKYFARERAVREAARRLANAIICPIHNLRKNAQLTRELEQKIGKSPRFGIIAAGIVVRTYEAYHEPVVTGRDGREYSAYDMDRAMMYGH